MNILRLSTFSLTIVLITMGALILPANTASAHCKGSHKKDPLCDEPHDDPVGLTYVVDLVGPDPDILSLRGAFEFDTAGVSTAASATLSRGTLNGAEYVTLTRPGSGNPEIVWNDVFNLCGLLGPWDENAPGAGPDDGSGPTNLDTFRVEAGDWEVSKGGGQIWLFLEFAIDQSYSDATHRDLSGALSLTGPCIDPVGDSSCEQDPLIPTIAGDTTYTELTDISIHLGGRGGVTHAAVCHADEDMLGASHSTLVITAN